MEETSGWVKVRTPDDYPGWMRLTVLRRLRPGELPYASAGNVVQVSSLMANVYHEPNVTKHAPLLTLPYEVRLEVNAERGSASGRWLEVRLPDGRLGWIQRGDVEPPPQPLTIPQSITLARRFLGVTYLWGGRSAFGYDCSGFTQMLVRARGIEMPRDAALEAAWQGVVPVERKHLRPGDLLFFGESRITHTGMYIGRGEFIHDTTHGHPGVQISRLSDEPWTKLLVTCRRVR